MVYVMGAGTTIRGFELAKKRNRLFTAITRSKAWVRISGAGPGMLELQQEFKQVGEKGYRLEFSYPTDTEIEKMRRIHRDMGKGEMEELAKDMKSVKRLAQRIADGQIDISSLPRDIRETLSAIAQQK